jgi:hypothetical protein
MLLAPCLPVFYDRRYAGDNSILLNDGGSITLSVSALQPCAPSLNI